MYLGRNIKLIRDKWELTQAEFGYLIGASRGMIMQYEKRGSTPKNETIEAIVEETGLSLDILMNTVLDESEIPDMSLEQLVTIDNYREDPGDHDKISTFAAKDELLRTSATKSRKTDKPSRAIDLLDDFFLIPYIKTEDIPAFLKIEDSKHQKDIGRKYPVPKTSSNDLDRWYAFQVCDWSLYTGFVGSICMNDIIICKKTQSIDHIKGAAIEMFKNRESTFDQIKNSDAATVMAFYKANYSLFAAVLQLNDKIMFKNVVSYQEDTDEFILRDSYTPLYIDVSAEEDFRVSAKEIKNIYLITSVIHEFNSTNDKLYFDEMKFIFEQKRQLRQL